MKTTIRPVNSILTTKLGWLALTCACLLAPTLTRAATIIYSGGTGTDIGTAANWYGGVLPSVSVPDTASFTNTATLSLTNGQTTLAGAAGNTGISITYTGTGALTIDSATSSVRMNGLGIGSSAGAFTLGNSSAAVFQFTLGGAAGTTQSWTNDSANAATINSDCSFGLGGGGAHTLLLAGTGNWTFNNVLSNASTTSALTVSKFGSGTLTINGNSTHTNGTLIAAGTLNIYGTTTACVSNNAPSGTTATVNMTNNVTLPNNSTFKIGNVAGGAGILNVSNGTWSGGNQPISAGTAGFGVINQTGGSITPGQFLVAGITGSGAVGIWNLSGGTFQTTGNNGGTLGATAGTTGQVNIVTSGSYTSTGNTANGLSGIFVGENGSGFLNISGNGQMSLGGISTSAGLDIGQINAATSIGIVNLGAVGAGGGTITANRVQKVGAAATGVLNFHGGFLKANAVANSTFMTGLSATYVYSEGANISNNAVAITVAQNLLAPTGSGVTAVASNASGFVTTGYSTAPFVNITGGTVTSAGSGATATASVDGSGNLTAINIMNPGTYSSTSGITVTLSGGGKSTTSSTTAVTTGANSSGGLNIGGGAAITLSGANTYTGDTRIGSGSLVLGTSTTISNSTLDLNNADSGTLSFGTVTTANFGGLKGSRNLSLLNTTPAAVALTVGGNNANTTYGGVMSGAAATLTKVGSGTLTLTNANTFTGNTTISAGGITLTGSGALASSQIEVQGGTTLDVSGVSFNVGSAQTLKGNGTITGGVSTTSGAQLVPGASVGLLTISGNLTLAGGTIEQVEFTAGTNDTINVGGNLSPSGVTVINIASLPGGGLANGNYTLINVTGTLGGTAANFSVSNAPSPSRQTFAITYDTGSSPKRVLLNVSGNASSLTWTPTNSAWDLVTTYNWSNGVGSDVYFDGDSVTFDDNGGATSPVLNVTVNPGSVTFNSSSNYSFTGTGKITGFSGITKSGSGSLTIGTTNDFTGVVSVSGSALVVSNLANGGSASGLGASTSASSNLVLNGATLQYNGATTSVNRGASIGASGGSLAVNESATTLTVSGVIAGSNGGGVTKSGSGVLALSGANTYDGSTTISAGNLAVSGGSAIPDASAVSLADVSGAALTVNASETIPSLAGGGSTGGNVAISTGTLTVNGTSSTTFSGALSGAGTLAKSGTSTLTLAGTGNTVATLNVNAGTVDLSTDLGLSGATLVAGSGGTINATGGGKILLNVAGGDFGVANGGTITNNAVIANGTQSSIDFWNTSSGTGIVVLTADNTFDGTLNLQSGVITVSNVRNAGTAGNLGKNATIHIGATTSAATLKYIGSGETSDKVIDLSGTTGGAILDQSGTGLLKFTGNLTASAVGSKTITLQGSTAGVGELAGFITNSATVTSNTSVFKDGSGEWTLSGANGYSGSTVVRRGTLNLSGAAKTSTTNSGLYIVDNNAAATFSPRLNISADVNAAQMWLGDRAGATPAQIGSVYQSAGVVTLSQGSSVDNLRIGSVTSGQGYYNLSGGSISANEIGLGGSLNNTIGVMDISGGTLLTPGWLCVGRGGGTSSGILNVSGTGVVSLTGLLDNTRHFRINWAGTAGAQSIVNVYGGGSIIGASSGVSSNTMTLDLSGANITGTLGAVNLNTGGTVQIYQVNALNANPTCLLNFNGGTLKATLANTSFINDANIDFINVYTNGATIDDNGVAVTVVQPLSAPTGNGVYGIASFTAGAGYVGAPMVTVVRGSGDTTGLGATAIAQIDASVVGATSGQVTNVVITSPGYNYTATPTFTLSSGGASTAATITGTTPVANVSGGLTKAGSGVATFTGASTYSGNVNVNAGTLSANLGNNVLNPTASALGNPQAARNLNVNNGGTLTLTGPDTFGSAISTIVSTLVINSNGVVNNAGNNFNTFGPLQLNGGTLTGTGGAISGYQMYNLRGTVTVGGTSASTISGSGANAGYHLAAPTTFDVADIATGSDLNVSGRFVNQDDTHGGVGSLTKIGVGTMTLSGSNSYAGLTVISNGTLALSGSGSIGGSSSIEVGSGATLDVSAGSFTLGGSQTLKGNGSVVGAANINGALTPGASIGTLTFSVAPTLAGSIVAEINSAASPNADKVVVSSGTLNFGGTLTVTNLGSAPASGTTFDLFDGSLSGSFTTLILPPGGTLHWLTGNLNVDGTITFTNNTPTISNAT
ncbi:MAG: toxins and related Ca2+-binding domain, partial [Verrucomicrobiota bacterium]